MLLLKRVRNVLQKNYPERDVLIFGGIKIPRSLSAARQRIVSNLGAGALFELRFAIE
jgi:hypothetical protein